MRKYLLGRPCRHAAIAKSVLTISLFSALALAHSAQNDSGCDANRPAVTYHSDGSSADASGAPIPCAGRTGFGAQETHVKVAPNGDVVEIPGLVPTGLPSFMQGGLAVSRDQGSSWQLVEPAGMQFQPNDNAIYFDRVTGRLHVALSTGFGAWLAGEVELLSSPALPQSYVRWTSQVMHGHVASENSRFTSAPPPDGQPKPIPGEQVVCWCGNTNPAVSSPPILARVCYRNLDGGVTWQRASILFTAGVPQHGECGTNAESFGALDGNYPQGASDGSLWLMVQCGGATYLAKSTDEAATFPIPKKTDGSPLTIPGLPRELRVDTAGNLYAVEKSGTSLLLRISRDAGQSWGDPLDMTAPAARDTSLGQWQMAVGAPGHVAATYLTTRPGGGSDGYISVTHDALDTNPVFYGSTINPPSAPLVTKSGFGTDFIDVDLDPEGTPWAAFYSDCPTDGSDAFCAQAKPYEGNAVTGPLATTIGRLAWSSDTAEHGIP